MTRGIGMLQHSVMISWLLVYCLILIVYVWYVWSVWYCTYWLLLLFVFDLCSHPVCWLWSSLLHAACLPALRVLAKLWWTERQRKFRLSAWFEFDWPPRNSWRVRFEIYWPLRKFGASAFCKLLSERCWNSYCSVLSYLCFDTLWNLFRKSTAERERCCSTSDIFSERVVSTWTLLLIVLHLLEPCYIVVDAGVQREPSARRSPEERDKAREAELTLELKRLELSQAQNVTVLGAAPTFRLENAKSCCLNSISKMLKNISLVWKSCRDK